MTSTIKQYLNKVLIIVIIIFLLEGINAGKSYGQTPPPPPPPNSGMNNGHNLGGNQGTPGAPLEGGLAILLILGAVYSYKKVKTFKNSLIEEILEGDN